MQPLFMSDLHLVAYRILYAMYNLITINYYLIISCKHYIFAIQYVIQPVYPSLMLLLLAHSAIFAVHRIQKAELQKKNWAPP